MLSKQCIHFAPLPISCVTAQTPVYWADSDRACDRERSARGHVYRAELSVTKVTAGIRTQTRYPWRQTHNQYHCWLMMWQETVNCEIAVKKAKLFYLNIYANTLFIYLFNRVSVIWEPQGGSKAPECELFWHTLLPSCVDFRSWPDLAVDLLRWRGSSVPVDPHRLPVWLSPPGSEDGDHPTPHWSHRHQPTARHSTSVLSSLLLPELP